MHNHMVPRVPPPYPEDWAPLTGSLFPPCPILTTLPSCFSPSSAGVWLRGHFSCALPPPPNPVTTNVTQKGCKKRSGAIKKKKKTQQLQQEICCESKKCDSWAGGRGGGGSTWQPQCRQAGGAGLHPHPGEARAGPGQCRSWPGSQAREASGQARAAHRGCSVNSCCKKGS